MPDEIDQEQDYAQEDTYPRPFPHVAAPPIPSWMERPSGGDDLPPPVPMWGGLRPPQGEVPIDEAAAFVRMAHQLRAQLEESRSAAIRYQGQMEYQKMIESGTPPDEAIRKAAPKMFYNDTGGFNVGLNMMRPRNQAPVTMESEGRTWYNTGNGWRLMPQGSQPVIKPPSTTPLHEQLRAVNTALGKAQARLLSGGGSAVQEAATTEIQGLEQQREQIESALAAAGEQVVQSPRSEVKMVPKVTTPPDMRSAFQTIMPNFLGGSPKPTPITNMVPQITRQPVVPPIQTQSGGAPPTVIQHPDVTDDQDEEDEDITPLTAPPDLLPSTLPPSTNVLKVLRIYKR